MKMTTPISVIDRALAQAMQEAKRKVVRMLAFLGEKCIIEARDRSQEESWYDQSSQFNRLCNRDGRSHCVHE